MKKLLSVPGIIALAGLILLATLFSGCVGSTGDKNTGSAAKTIETLRVTGSTTVLPIAQLTAEAYMEENLYADILVSGGGSSVGVQAVGEGTADIGMASRDLKEAEKETYPDLVSHVVARDGIAVIVHRDNPVEKLTIGEVKSVYKGEITNWKELGGDEMEIVVVGRDSASGTKEYFYKSVMDKEDFVRTQLEKNSNGAVKQTIAQTPGAVGYVSLGYIDNTLLAVKIKDGGKFVEPTVDNVINGDYPIARSLNMFTKGEPTGLAAEYLAYITGADGQKLVAEEGFVPLA
ncbi:MAG: phosphate ABC transporter substrate-binding protein [Euryarchaeota archaeon]|nr:phosphate ABC transporter substrate-binding protein [Euryarchaeota archaeon]